jgi:hypothetical protein
MNDDNLTTPRSTRVPIPLTAQEEKKLASLAKKESRSRQAMAGIIYRAGLKAYLKGVDAQQ